MFAMITTEEYKELLEAQRDAELYRKLFKGAERELIDLKDEFNRFLLLITKGQKKSEWSSGYFNNYDLADLQTIAEYINEKYLENGILKLKENDND